MNRVLVEGRSPVTPSAPNRTDVACFVGFVAVREPSSTVLQWLDEEGWIRGPHGRPEDAAELLDVPVPVDDWQSFDRLFDWRGRRMGEGGTTGASYLGAAVRSFFAEGGRKCYVVRTGDPWRFGAPRGERLGRLGELLPGHPPGLRTSPRDRSTWRGVGHLLGLPDVAFLSLPDLPDAVAMDPAPVEPPEPPPRPLEGWVECSDAPSPRRRDGTARRLPAPRCHLVGYRDWARALRVVVDLVARWRRDVQVVAGVPIPASGARVDEAVRRHAAEEDLLAFLAAGGWLLRGPSESPEGLASSFLQLAYPWARTSAASWLPEGLESPEGPLAGVLARNALLRGSFTSAGHLPLHDVREAAPALARRQSQAPPPPELRPGGHPWPLADRVSLLGPSPAGMHLVSDVTTSPSPSYRPAAVGRLVGAVVRAARRHGNASVFESSDELLWARLRERISVVLLDFLRAGALRGASAAEAFSVRCDRSTMSQNDIDNGRIRVEVRLQAAAPVDRIRVVLAMDEAGGVSLAAREPEVA